MKALLEARPSPIAGRWYEGNPLRLAAEVDAYLDNAQLPELGGEIVAVIAPHAGYLYSGPVAGYAFAATRGLTPDLVIVVSPMHHPYVETLLTTAHSAYATPLGTIPVDQQLVDKLEIILKESLGFGLARVAYDQEHSLEIELPFLQRALPTPFRLLPVMVRQQSAAVAKRLGEALARLIVEEEMPAGHSVILVASTDLSHFYPQRIAKEFDEAMLRQVEAFDPEGVIAIENRGKGFACGRGAVAAVLWAAKALGADQVKRLKYATSGDVTGDYEQVVGYGAAVVLRHAEN